MVATKKRPSESPVETAVRAVPGWLLDHTDAPLEIQSFRGDLEIQISIDGVFRAVVELCSADGDVVPIRLAMCGSRDAMPLGASQPAASRVFGDVAQRGQRLLARLDSLPAPDRLPQLRRWLSSYHDLFTSRLARTVGVY